MAEYQTVSGDGKPDLFEMATLQMLAAYQLLWRADGFAWPAISEALQHVSEAGQILETALAKRIAPKQK